MAANRADSFRSYSFRRGLKHRVHRVGTEFTEENPRFTAETQRSRRKSLLLRLRIFGFPEESAPEFGFVGDVHGDAAVVEIEIRQRAAGKIEDVFFGAHQ